MINQLGNSNYFRIGHGKHCLHVYGLTSSEESRICGMIGQVDQPPLNQRQDTGSTTEWFLGIIMLLGKGVVVFPEFCELFSLFTLTTNMSRDLSLTYNYRTSLYTFDSLALSLPSFFFLSQLMYMILFYISL